MSVSEDRLPIYRQIAEPCTWNPSLPHGFVMHSKDGPDGVTAALEYVRQVTDWCKLYLGPPSHYRAKDTRWAMIGSHVRFRDADDAFAFKMRWC